MNICDVRTRWINVDKDVEKAKQMQELLDGLDSQIINDFLLSLESSHMRVCEEVKNTTAIVQSHISRF